MNSTQVFMIAVPEDTRESAPQAVAASTLAPARALGLDRPGKTTTALGWWHPDMPPTACCRILGVSVQTVICDGHRIEA